MEFNILQFILFIIFFGIVITTTHIIIPYLEKKKEILRKEEEVNKNKILENKIKEQIQDFDFGVLGKIKKEIIDIDNIITEAKKQNNNISEQVKFAINKINEWKDIIEKHHQYIINYFMSMVLIETADTDNPFWDYYITDKNIYNNEKCLQIFREKYTEEFEKELNKYEVKENPKNIDEIFKNHFSFFDYDEYIKDVHIRYLTLNINTFSIQINDLYSTCLCEAYEEFDKDLNGLDWHNF